MDERSRDASRKVRLTEVSLRAKLFGRKTLGNTRQQTEKWLKVYQRGMFLSVTNGMALTGDRWRPPNPIDWELRTETRRFTPRQRPLLNVRLSLITSDHAFSMLMSQMRFDTWNGIRASGIVPPKTNYHFSSFFFCLRGLIMAYRAKRLYAINASFSSFAPDVVESIMVGFVQVTPSTDIGEPRRFNGGKRKRIVVKQTFWIDLFEVFPDYRRYGIGLSATKKFPELIEQDFATHKTSSICLNPLESAEPFWKRCGYRWSSPKKSQGHLQKSYKRPKLA